MLIRFLHFWSSREYYSRLEAGQNSRLKEISNRNSSYDSRMLQNNKVNNLFPHKTETDLVFLFIREQKALHSKSIKFNFTINCDSRFTSNNNKLH